MFTVVAVAAAVLALAWAILYVKQTLDAGAQFRFVDTDKPVPSAGLISSQFHLTHLHESQEALPKQLGDASVLYMLAKPALLLGDAPAVREMMMERWQEFERIADSFKDNPHFGQLLQESLFILDDDEWKVQSPLLHLPHCLCVILSPSPYQGHTFSLSLSLSLSGTLPSTSMYHRICS